MPGHPNLTGNRRVDRSSSCSSRASDVNDRPQESLKPEDKRSPLLSTSKSSAKFDAQVAALPIRFQAMTRISRAATAMEKKPQPESLSHAGNSTSEGTGDHSDGDSTAARKSCIKRDQRLPGEISADSEQPVGLLVTLFHDGFVCRHINKENESIEGFAQPYDAESSYFLACIDNGRVPEGLTDMIACAHCNGGVLAEIRDFREMRTALCPVSSAFLPAALALPQTNDITSCRVWQTLLMSGKIPLPIHGQYSPLFEPPTLQSMFDHFPDITPGELETLAMDAKLQLLQEEDVWLSSSSTESSSPQDEPGFPPAKPQEDRLSRKSCDASLTTTPTTRSRFPNGLEASPPASLLSPIERKSARSSLNGQEDNSTKRCKRQIQTKLKGACKSLDSNKEEVGLKSDSITSSVGYRSTEYRGIERCESPRRLRPQQQVRGGYSALLAEDDVPITPLPATQLFLSKLKGKRHLPENELLYGKPAWVTIAHVGRFFRAATRLEREHSRFLQVNARLLMQAEKPPPAETEHVAGSMHNLARQLGNLTRPSDVIAVAGARELKVAQDEGRELREPGWIDNGGSSPSPAWQSAESTVDFATPDSDPVLNLQRTGTAEDVLLGHFFDLTTDTDSLTQETQPTAAAPHFNAFDDDGNLQLQFA